MGKNSGGIFRLPSKVTGCIIWSSWFPQNRKVVMLVNHDQFEQNGSKVVSIVYELLHIVLAEFKKLPKKLHINLDNCWRYVSTSFLLLVANNSKFQRKQKPVFNELPDSLGSFRSLY